MNTTYYGGWTKKCPSCGKELWSNDYPDFFKIFDYTKIFCCPRCHTNLKWSKNHTLMAKYGISISAIVSLIFAATLFNAFSSGNIDSLKLTDPAMPVLIISFSALMLSLLIGVIGMIGKSLVIVDRNA